MRTRLPWNGTSVSSGLTQRMENTFSATTSATWEGFAANASKKGGAHRCSQPRVRLQRATPLSSAPALRTKFRKQPPRRKAKGVSAAATHCVRTGVRSGPRSSGRLPSPGHRWRCAGRRSGAGSRHRTFPAGILWGRCGGEAAQRPESRLRPRSCASEGRDVIRQNGCRWGNRNRTQCEPDRASSTVTGPV